MDANNATRAVTLGVAQYSAALGETEENLEGCVRLLRTAARAGCSLVAFPECCLTGYLAASEQEAYDIALPLDGAWLDRVREECRVLGLRSVVGLIERDGPGIYNTAALISEHGVEARYRKIHLPMFGADRFVRAGDRAVVKDTPIGRIGFAVCYDLRFPELCRMVALDGADIIVHITNFSQAAAAHMDFTIRARAAENRVYLMSANCHGESRGFTFSGLSAIVDPDGNWLARAPEAGNAVITAQASLSRAWQSRIVLAPGEHEFDLLADRRPGVYGRLASETEAHVSTRRPVG